MTPPETQPDELPTVNRPCKRCIELGQVSFHARTEFIQHRMFAEVDDAASTGCPICLPLQEGFRNMENAKDLHRGTKIQILLSETPRNSTTRLLRYRIFTFRNDGSYAPSSVLKSLQIAIADTATGMEIPNYIAPYTRDPSVISRALSWLEDCKSFHSQCRQKMQNYSPPRLISISGRNLRLVELRDAGVIDGIGWEYGTLSHCWGENPKFLQLTVDNLQQLCEGFQVEALPATFRDAISVCQSLGIRYLWIDSLCIIQTGDNGSDWVQHLHEMRRIYQNCLVNIAAANAAAATEGMFVRRTPQRLHPTIFHYNSTTNKTVPHIVLCDDSLYMRLRFAPLGERGWVFQERLFSPRVLHFSQDQLLWECSKSLCCETCPTGITSHSQANSGQSVGLHSKTFQAPSVLSDFPFSIPELIFSGEGDKQNALELYYTYVQDYTRRKLSFPDLDKLPAFSGIAEHFATCFKDTYIAGLFQSQLPRALLWAIDQPATGPASHDTYRCPSWSWAKIDTSVPLQKNLQWIEYDEYSSDLMHIVNINISLLDTTNPYGRLLAAELTVQARLERITWRVDDVDGEIRGVCGSHISPVQICVTEFDNVSDKIVDQTVHPTFWLPISCRTNVGGHKFQKLQKSVVHGILVRPQTKGGLHRFERVGRMWIDGPQIQSRVLEIGGREIILV